MGTITALENRLRKIEDKVIEKPPEPQRPGESAAQYDIRCLFHSPAGFLAALKRAQEL